MRVRRFPWITVGVVATLWLIIGGAAVSGWMVGKHASADAISQLRKRVAMLEHPSPATCRMDIHYLDARSSDEPRDRDSALLREPRYMHLRQMLTTR